MSSILTVARDFRAEVLRGDRDMLRQLSQAYSLIDKSLNREFRELQREIEQAQREGKTVNRDWLRRSFRYQQLIRQVKGQVASYSFNVRQVIEGQQRNAIDLGQLHATSLITAALPEITFARLPAEAINELVGVMQDGSPLSKALDKLGPQAAKQMREALITGLASGHGADKIAREARSGIDLPRWKALQIARTETMRAYRQSTLRTYVENSDVLDGWTWISTLSSRTCPACWAMHGTFFPLSKDFFPAHVSCRCTSIPAVKGSDQNVTSGSAAFASLPVEQQQVVLGPSKYEMYQQGTPLMGFVSLSNDSEWGSAFQTKSVAQVKQNASPPRLPTRDFTPEEPKHRGGPRTFTSDSEAADWGKANWQHVQLSNAEIENLRRYQSAGYQNVNPMLRGQKQFSGEREADYRQMVREVDSALRHQTLPESVTVYRAVGREQFGELSEKLTGKVFEEKAFMSTAVASKVPREFKGKQVVLKLHVPEGTPGYFMPLVATDARMRAERELLLGRGLKYRITAARYNSRSGKWELDAEIILNEAKQKKAA